MIRHFFSFLLCLSLFTSCKTETETEHEAEEEVYMFTSFREPATDGLHMLYSYDGYNWTDLEGVFLKPEVGPNKLMRDPSMVQ